MCVYTIYMRPVAGQVLTYNIANYSSNIIAYNIPSRAEWRRKWITRYFLSHITDVSNYRYLSTSATRLSPFNLIQMRRVLPLKNLRSQRYEK